MALALSNSALAAAVLVATMLGIYLVTGIGQDPLQWLHLPAVYTDLLLRQPSVLQLVIGLDNGFIALYTFMFLALGAILVRDGHARAFVVSGVTLLLATAVLDLIENMHFLVMVSAAEQGLPVGDTEIRIQTMESLVKFHLSYVGLFLLGFALPQATTLERLLRFLFRWVQLPVGLLIHVTPPAWSIPLVFARFSFFLVALLGLAIVYRRRGSGSNAPVRSQDTMPPASAGAVD